ncbi:hypothetical protein CBR_g10912 [Chara braunii]|uniref:Integrase catalytic domain-containing protein n=1 Tax=Chara braunii TaxID=69332 RepID=A0A388KPJ1_CHABU|nr:hypothetical protein CBR_g10912 [Chara braunii]|eukprot:GBG71974.1 hypothetical protein CBR_g10912 [Chara braunii]
MSRTWQDEDKHGNALTHVEGTLTTLVEFFDKAAKIIVTNKEAKNLHHSSATGPSRDQHRPKVAVVVAATPIDQTSEAVSANEGDKLVAAWDGGRPGKCRGRGKTKTNTASSAGPSQQLQPHGPNTVSPSKHTRHARDSIIVCGVTAISTRQWAARRKARANWETEHCREHMRKSIVLLFFILLRTILPGSFLRCTHAQGQDVYVASSPSDNGNLSSSRDSAREFNIEVLDPLTSEDFVWLPVPTMGRLSGPQCAALCAHLHTYLSFYAPPTSPTDDEVMVGDILAYVTKVGCEFRKQWYDDNNAPPLYVRIQVGQASCSALLDSGASRNFMSQAVMKKAGLGAQVRRKANPTTIKLADGRTQQLIDRYVEAVPVDLAPHACEPVTFDILDTDFDIILGMAWLESADHTVNFHRRTLTVRYAFGSEFADIFESLTGVVSDRLISHEIIPEAGVVPPTGCIYLMSEEELTGLRAQLDGLMDKGWIRPSSSHRERQFSSYGRRTRIYDCASTLRALLVAQPSRRRHTLLRVMRGLLTLQIPQSSYGKLRPLPVSLRQREAITMNITGPFPKHKAGVGGILTVVDRLTKFAMFLPCRYHAKAPELAEVLYSGWIRTKGYPKEIVCNRGTRFMFDFLLALIK